MTRNAAPEASSVRARFPRRAHDHAACVRDAMRRAETECQIKSVRLTPLRRRILELIWMSHRPIGAYSLLAELARERRGAAPPTVYRSLQFLLSVGLVHRIQSLNAYVGCTAKGVAHASQFLICGACGSAAELADATIVRTLNERARRLRFVVQRQTVEVEGLCPDCQGAERHAR